MKHPKVDFKKIKINSDGEIYIELSEHTSEGLIEKKESYPFKPHDDFRNAFKGLVPFICIYAEQFDKKGIEIPAEHNPEDENAQYMECRTVSLNGTGESGNIIITGVRYLSYGSAITINTPQIKNTIPENPSKEVKDFTEALGKLKAEAMAFVYDKKHAPDIQGKMFQDDNTEGEEN